MRDEKARMLQDGSVKKKEAFSYFLVAMSFFAR